MQSKKEILSSIVTESKMLSRILRSSYRIPDNQTLRILGERQLMMEKMMIPYVVQNAFSYSDGKKQLMSVFMSQSNFINDIRKSFSENNPRFILHLHTFSLTADEIDYCILLAFGLRGYEIGMMTGDKSHYNKSSSIRHKLGLTSNDTNLGNHLRNLLDESRHETF